MSTNRYDSLTVLEYARAIATAYGYTVDDDRLGHLIWAHTGWPSFWPARYKTARQAFFQQLRSALAVKECMADNCGDLEEAP